MFTFKEIVGHKKEIAYIQNAIVSKKMAHSYIINGPEGIGKMLFAKTFAKTIQCEQGGAEPCNQCASCKAFDTGNHPDVIFVSSDKKSIGVDDIREKIQQDIEIKPYKYPYKIYIVDDADTMTIQAQNALLKTLEEPKGYAIIMLISRNINQFLSTILSRCVVIKLNPLRIQEINDYLEKKGMTDYKLFATLSQGSIGLAEKMISSEDFLNLREKTISWARELHEGNLLTIFKIQQEMAEYKEDIGMILDILYLWYRDLLILSYTNNIQHLINDDKKEYMNISLSLEQISKCLEAIENAKKQLHYNANFQLVIEVMLMNFLEQ